MTLEPIAYGCKGSGLAIEPYPIYSKVFPCTFLAFAAMPACAYLAALSSILHTGPVKCLLN